jgi:hypothetical protein
MPSRKWRCDANPWMERQYATMQYIIASILLPFSSTLLPRLHQQTDGSTYQSPCGDARCRWQLCPTKSSQVIACWLGPTHDIYATQLIEFATYEMLNMCLDWHHTCNMHTGGWTPKQLLGSNYDDDVAATGWRAHHDEQSKLPSLPLFLYKQKLAGCQSNLMPLQYITNASKVDWSTTMWRTTVSCVTYRCSNVGLARQCECWYDKLGMMRQFQSQCWSIPASPTIGLVIKQVAHILLNEMAPFNMRSHMSHTCVFTCNTTIEQTMFNRTQFLPQTATSAF